MDRQLPNKWGHFVIAFHFDEEDRCFVHCRSNLPDEINDPIPILKKIIEEFERRN